MEHLTTTEIILRLAEAGLFGGLIGLERETHGRPAGLRTHILVCMGSALFALCSSSIAGGRFDPGRITAQIVTGMGFLGAGTIMRQGSAVRGLTTAASMWTVAAIGIAVAIGGNMLVVAAVVTAMVVVTLNVVPHLERWLLHGRDDRVVTIVTHRDSAPVCAALSVLAKHGVKVRVVGTEEGPEQGTQILRLRVRSGGEFDDKQLAADLTATKDVISYSWE